MNRSVSLGMVVLTIQIVCIVAMGTACSAAKSKAPADPQASPRALHKQAPLIDGHNDLPWQLRQLAGRNLEKMDIRQPQPRLQTDIPRLNEGGVGGVFWSVYVPAAARRLQKERKPSEARIEEMDGSAGAKKR